ncbi:AzlD domain-containing protein [Pseudooceanicola sediminis]|uniref:AzlD domain-containing protein n=1 Tax=Pseudooceanicola sediminis TaxID=2211117 RepID=A0A399J4D3_9RHOB|nr:AzlD domain-containing protein [Pseudooceanicola sediminis]KAA2314597.1 AzlD domain-containing protein [Puniceibacterium sp. HSS470]RII39447.1 AzlD domain-containing protein [Pseudooceanicola sediminis]|tara:strand:+ start:31949 stop:32305 length:357 start_codon:yes stop_codon:yes gene_type:complete
MDASITQTADTINHVDLWIVIIGLGLGSFALRFVFIGLIGDRPMPEWLLRHLRYTAVAILPAIVAPLVAWPAATEGQLDPARFIAAMVTVIAGIYLRNTLIAILGGATTLYVMLWLVG